jgi:predicted nucleotidyltransferase
LTDYARLLQVLTQAGVEYIVVGGAAATAHGSARLTLDLDIVYRRTPENIDRVAASLSGHSPYLRGAPAGLPFIWDAPTIASGLNFTLITDLGELDVLGEIIGGTFESLLTDTIVLTMFGIDCRCLTLERLIAVKHATGRPKDLEALAELEALLEERDR